MDIIVTHTNADFDALASLVAAKRLYPAARIVLPNTQERSVKEFIGLIKGAIKIEDEKDIDFNKMSRLVIVDTRVKNRLGKVAGYLNKSNLKIHIYDHHPRNKTDLKASKDIYEPSGATVTMLLNILKRKKIEISALEATIFAMGIYEDTGSLTYQTTTKKDVDMISYLFVKGANLSMISSYLNRELSDEEMLLLATLLNSTKTYVIGDICMAIAQAMGEEFKGDLALVTHKLLDIENINVIFTLVKLGNRIQLIARSRLKEVDVSNITGFFGGGGHLSAASATIKNQNLDTVRDTLLKILKRKVKSKLLAKDIMTCPVKTLSLAQSVREAKIIIDGLKIKGAPVVEKGRTVGIITKKDLTKTIRHGFGHASIKGYMSKNLTYVTPQTSISTIQKLISQKNIGRLPVLDKKKLVGIITRTDILQATHGEVFRANFKPKKKMVTRLPEIKNLKRKMKAELSPKVFKLLKTIGRIADGLGVTVYIVGGFVRDLILQKKNLDMDFVVEGDALGFAQKLARIWQTKIKIHKRFRTANLKLTNGIKIDITTARIEVYEYPAALPRVNMSSLKNDLARRDFTINTLAIRLNGSNFGELIDFFEAKKDLRGKKIKVLHDLSFIEDPTRILRAVRLEQRLCFSIDKHTENLIRAAVDLEMFGRLNKFRMGDELCVLLKEPYPLKVIKRMAQLHELRFIHPKIRLNKNMAELLESVEEVLGWYKLSFLHESLDRWLIFFLALLDNLNKNQSLDLIRQYGFNKKAKLCTLRAKTDGVIILSNFSRKKRLKPSYIYKQLKSLPKEVVLFLMAKA